jgi:hypothetical protein
MALWKILNVLGLFISLVGAGMLFFRSTRKLHIGDLVITPDIEWQNNIDLGPSAVLPPEGSPTANRLWRRWRYLNSLGFGLIALGTFLQILGTVL